jgi:ketosteroid isomerase-like protein
MCTIFVPVAGKPASGGRSVHPLHHARHRERTLRRRPFKVEPHDILANDSHAVAIATASAEKDGKKLNDRYTHVVHISDGKVTESWIFDEHQDTVDEFWG